tara:strand:+ start:602 stop:1018 length:417 start_codon:yes stop_codon:yes gene_type:complete
MDFITDNIKNCDINKLDRIDKLGHNKEWCLSAKNTFLKAHEIKDFISFFEKQEIIDFLATNDLVFSAYLTKFFYKGWGDNYLDISNFEKFRLSLLQSGLRSYISLNPTEFTHLDDVLNTLQLIIQIHEQILVLNDGFR